MTTQRVAFVLPHFRTGGVERVTLQILIHLDRSRFAPALVLLKREGDLLAELPDDVAVFDLGGARAASAPLAMRRVLREAGAEVVCCANNAVNLLVLLATRGGARRPKVVVADHTPLSAFIETSKWRRLRAWLVRALYPRADALCAPIEAVLDEYRRLLGPRTPPLWRLDNPVLPSTPAAPTDAALTARMEALARPRLLAVGRLSEEKGMDVLLDAAAALKARGVSFSLAVMGDGQERAGLEEQARALGLGDQAMFFGNVPNAQSYFSSFDVFALTSRREGFGNVLIEAMGAGLGAVAVDCPFGPRMILRDGALGRLVPMGDRDALVGALDDMLTQPDMRARFGEAGRRAAERYRADVAVKAWERMLTATVSGGAPAS